MAGPKSPLSEKRFSIMQKDDQRESRAATSIQIPLTPSTPAVHTLNQLIVRGSGI